MKTSKRLGAAALAASLVAKIQAMGLIGLVLLGAVIVAAGVFIYIQVQRLLAIPPREIRTDVRQFIETNGMPPEIWVASGQGMPAGFPNEIADPSNPTNCLSWYEVVVWTSTCISQSCSVAGPWTYVGTVTPERRGFTNAQVQVRVTTDGLDVTPTQHARTSCPALFWKTGTPP